MKNVEKVFEAFLEGNAHQEKTIQTNGSEIFSYNLLIAEKRGLDNIWVRDPDSTKTTNSHIRELKKLLRELRFAGNE